MYQPHGIFMFPIVKCNYHIYQSEISYNSISVAIIINKSRIVLCTLLRRSVWPMVTDLNAEENLLILKYNSLELYDPYLK